VFGRDPHLLLAPGYSLRLRGGTPITFVGRAVLKRALVMMDPPLTTGGAAMDVYPHRTLLLGSAVPVDYPHVPLVIRLESTKKCHLGLITDLNSLAAHRTTPFIPIL
jgi:hypothetical protein